MKTYTEKDLANLMLEMRRDGFVLRRHIARNLKEFILFFIYLALALVATAWIQTWGPFGFLIGLTVGMFSRDRLYLQQRKKAWPFYLKVTDWEKVEKIANENASA